MISEFDSEVDKCRPDKFVEPYGEWAAALACGCNSPDNL
jgi:hypothetical protein